MKFYCDKCQKFVAVNILDTYMPGIYKLLCPNPECGHEIAVIHADLANALFKLMIFDESVSKQGN